MGVTSPQRGSGSYDDTSNHVSPAVAGRSSSRQYYFWTLGGSAGDSSAACQGGRSECTGADHRRERHGKRHYCAAHPRTFSLEVWPLGEGQLSVHSRNAAGKRVV